MLYNQDWGEFLKENNLTTKDVDFYLNNILDTPKFNKVAGEIVDVKNDIYTIKESSVHGTGVFAKKNIKKGDVIGIVIGFKNDNKYRSYLGRFTNHSNIKNAIFKQIDNNDVIAICVKDIDVNEEILVDYRDHFKKW
jgi:SET domain-containing protein